MKFSDLSLGPAVLQAVEEAGFQKPTPIQAEAIPAILSGRDVLGCARTGTGKTAAFALPLIQRLEDSWTASREIRARSLVLSPTRELARQLFENISAFARHTELVPLLVHGGVGLEEQAEALRAGADILVATPGRVLDLVARRAFRLDQVEIFVLDEADRMLDMGFAPDIRKMAGMLPPSRQAIFLSATMPKEALQLADSFLRKPRRIAVDPVSAAAENIDLSLYYVEKRDKPALLGWLFQRLEYERVLVFCRTRRGADLLGERMEKAGVPVAVLHGDKSQSCRRETVEAFRQGGAPILIATDLAARGIDIEGISHIVNFDLPGEAETFVHRIGRTARAGASGQAISFCDPTEKGYLHEILRHLGEEPRTVLDHPYHSEQTMNYSGRAQPRKKASAKGRSRGKGAAEKSWRLAPAERNRLHAAPEGPKKNARRNPKRKRGGR